MTCQTDSVAEYLGLSWSWTPWAFPLILPFPVPIRFFRRRFSSFCSPSRFFFRSPLLSMVLVGTFLGPLGGFSTRFFPVHNVFDAVSSSSFLSLTTAVTQAVCLIEFFFVTCLRVISHSPLILPRYGLPFCSFVSSPLT